MTRYLVSPGLGHPSRNAVARPGALSHGRGDYLVGALVSLTIIVGGAWLGEFAKARPSKLRVVAVAVTARFIETPWIEPDTPEAAPEDRPNPADLRPPMLADLPDLGRPHDFVQPLEPPPAGALDPTGSLITIPAVTERRGLEGSIFDPSQLDRQPVPITQARPNYPFEMKRQGVSGQVLVDFIVDASGHVSRVMAAGSSNREFEPAAVAAVSKWRFQPGRKSGRAVNTHMQVPIVFTLNPDA